MRISAQGFKADSQLVTTVIGGDCVTSSTATNGNRCPSWVTSQRCAGAEDGLSALLTVKRGLYGLRRTIAFSKI